MEPCSKNSGPHWPRLLKAPGKLPHVKTDFNKWVDEDEEDEMERGACGRPRAHVSQSRLPLVLCEQPYFLTLSIFPDGL